MSTGTDISALYREFTDALTECCWSGSGAADWLKHALRSKRNHQYSESGYRQAVEAAFNNWETI